MIEDVLNDMKSVLERHLDGELTKQDGKFGDGIKLESIRDIVVGDETLADNGLPAMVLWPNGSSSDHLMSGKKDVTHDIAIRLAVSGEDDDKTQKRLWRTMRAIENAMEIYGPGTGVIINYKTTGKDYHASVFGIDAATSSEKCGEISCTILERQDAYVATQL